MDTHARVVIVGGGAMGTGLAYHLAEEGWSDTVLVEKGELTSGSTWHAAGLCTYFIGGYAIGQLHAHGVKFYPRLEELTGQYVSWHPCGSLRLATDEGFVDWFRYVQSIAPRLGYEVEVLTPSQISEVHPFLSLDGVLAGALTRGDGHVDPAGVATAMAKGAESRGVKIRRRCRVTGIKREASGEWRLRTEQGDIVAEHVVNAAGCYARRVQEMVGGTVPIANMQHHSVVTEAIAELAEREEELPAVRDPHANCSLRQEQHGGMIGVYEAEGAAEAWDGGEPAWESEHELFEPDFDRIAPWLQRGMERVPVFGKAGIRRVVHGAISHTPDSHPLLGPAPGLRNFWMCCGTSIGIAQGAGAGRYLAQWMVHGDAEISMAAFDPRRFGDWASREYARAKSVQDYATMYEARLPGVERPAGRPVRTSALYGKLAAKGAVHTEASGWERPKWFSADGRSEAWSFRRSNVHDLVGEECRAVRGRVGVMDQSSLAKFEISGPGAEALVGRLYANRPPDLGRVTLAHRLSPNGRILGESTIARFAEDRFYAVSAAGWERRDMDAFDEAGVEGAAVANLTEDLGALLVAGPRARDALQPLTETDLGSESFPWLAAREMAVAGVEARALRISSVGSLGWELHVSMRDLETLYESVWESGAKHGIADFGAYAADSLRLERGCKKLGAELTNAVTPVEADVMRFARGSGYQGEDAVRLASESEPAMKIAYLELRDAEDADVQGGEAVHHDGQAVGAATSGGYGHATGRSLLFAYLPPALTRPGQEVELRVLGSRKRAVVLEGPVCDPDNREIRA